MKKYIVLDSNNIVCFFEGGFSLAQQKGVFSAPEEIIVLEHLLTVLDKNKVSLILPEVVILECERIKEEKKEDLSKLYAIALKGVDDASIPNKTIAAHSRGEIKKTMEDLCEEEKDKIEIAWSLFKKIINNKNTHVIELNGSILLSAYKRGLMGKKPFVMRHSNSKDPDFNNKPLHDIQPDCILVESVKFFLADKKDYELYLGTNDNNFFTSNEKKIIDPNIQRELMVKKAYLTLSDLLNKVLGIKIPIRQKIDKEQNLNAFPLISKSATVESKGEDDPLIVKG